MSNLAQFVGYRDIPLIPDFDEPAFCTSGYGQNPIFIYNHNCQMIQYGNWPGGEMSTTTYFNQNWNSPPSSNSSFSYAGTALAGPHGHLFASSVMQMSTNANQSVYLGSVHSGSGTYYGAMNSQSTGVWVNKTKRDNLCIQRVNSGYTSYNYATQISTVGFGALFNPITSTRAFSGVGPGVANGYNTSESYGLIGYNELTKMWVVAGTAAAGSNTLYVYKNVNAPTLANSNNQTFWNQFNHSTKISVPFTFTTYNDSRDYQHYKLIPLDDGNIALISKYAQNDIRYTLFTGNNGVDSTSWTYNTTPLATISTTTSYHNSNNTQMDALPAMVSYDGRYVVVFTQYYYYYSGLCAFVIRVSDGQARKINIADTTYAYNPVFVQANTLLVGYGVNADGAAGMTLYNYDLDYIFATTSNYADVTVSQTTTKVELPYTTTQYPMIWSAQSYLPNFIRGVF